MHPVSTWKEVPDFTVPGFEAGLREGRPRTLASYHISKSPIVIIRHFVKYCHNLLRPWNHGLLGQEDLGLILRSGCKGLRN